MGSEADVVYLEDLEPVAGLAKKGAATDAVVGEAAGSSSSSSTTTSVKRQRTLMDMFSGSQGKGSSDSSSKKLKLSPAKSNSSGASSSVTKASSTISVASSKSFGTPKLNSIPFSLVSYQASLSDEHKALLRLECEAMGKSW